MNTAEITELKALLSEPKRIVVIGHKNPDGDAIGSTLGLSTYLEKLGHNVRVMVPNDYPKFLKWMPGNEDILKFETHSDNCGTLLKKAHLVFTLDFNALHRLGPEMEAVLDKLDCPFVMIDHHQQPDDYARFTYSDASMGSTSEMVYHFMKMRGHLQLLDAQIATNLYVGIMTDSGSFRFPATTSTTHRVVADLIDHGAQNSDIHRAVYDNNSENRMQLLGKALNNLRVLPEQRTAYISLSQQELDACDFKKGDTEGFVNYALSIENVVLAAIFIESEKDEIIKISLRSKGDFSVNEVAREHFEGGGHINAAGGKSTRNMADTITYFISILPSYQNALLNA